MRNLVELHLTPEIYAAALEALPKLKRLALKLEAREHFVLQNTEDLLLIAISSDRVGITEVQT